MDKFLFTSVVFEVAIILACLIFTVLLISTKILTKRVSRNGVMLFLNILFIAGFYLLINMQWFEIAKPLIWLFVPATISISLFFYRFNTLWMKYQMKLDRFLGIVPIGILVIALALELLNYIVEDETAQLLRFSFTENTLRYLFTLYAGLLIGLNFYKIHLAERKNRQTYSEHHLVNLNWSRISLVFYFLFYAGMILSELSAPLISELIFNVSILMLTLYLGYYQIKVIARYLSSTNQPIGSVKINPIQSPNALPDVDKLTVLFERIDSLIHDEKLHLKTDLTIHELGVRLKMNSKYLSQAINHQDGLNFNKYINQKRIEQSKVLLFDDNYNKYSLEGIAQESGFRSKSTFNTTFKSITGVTPSEYRKKGSQD